MNRFPNKEEAELAFENERQKLAESSARSHERILTFGRIMHLAIFLGVCAGVVVAWVVFIELLGLVIEPATLTGENNTMAGIWLGLILAYLVINLALVIGAWRYRPRE